MNSASENPREMLIDRLATEDEGTRGCRADRLLWASTYVPPHGGMVGRLESLSLLDEARGTFVAGHYVATLIVSSAYIEHVLNEALPPLVGGERRRMSNALKLAKEHGLFSLSLLDRATRLSTIRNPYAHLRPVDDADTLGQRMCSENVHPRDLQEVDAKEALSLMYEFMREALNRWGKS